MARCLTISSKQVISLPLHRQLILTSTMGISSIRCLRARMVCFRASNPAHRPSPHVFRNRTPVLRQFQARLVRPCGTPSSTAMSPRWLIARLSRTKVLSASNHVQGRLPRLQIEHLPTIRLSSHKRWVRRHLQQTCQSLVLILTHSRLRM